MAEDRRVEDMDRNEKKRLREAIGERLDVSNARLSDDEAELLHDFVEDYDDKYRGQSTTRTSSHVGWSSDGKYIRTEEYRTHLQTTSAFARTIGTTTMTANPGNRLGSSRMREAS